MMQVKMDLQTWPLKLKAQAQISPKTALKTSPQLVGFVERRMCANDCPN